MTKFELALLKILASIALCQIEATHMSFRAKPKQMLDEAMEIVVEVEQPRQKTYES